MSEDLQLVTFRIKKTQWKQFLECATERGESGTSLMVKLCNWVIEGNSTIAPTSTKTPPSTPDDIDKRFAEAETRITKTVIASLLETLGESLA